MRVWALICRKCLTDADAGTHVPGMLKYAAATVSERPPFPLLAGMIQAWWWWLQL
jgi:hypothetical protein